MSRARMQGEIFHIKFRVKPKNAAESASLHSVNMQIALKSVIIGWSRSFMAFKPKTRDNKHHVEQDQGIARPALVWG